MTKDEIYARIQKILVEQKGEDFLISPDLSLNDQIAEDSVEVMEFVISLEDEFGMDISDHDIENLTTLSDIVSYIQNKNVR
ncbi:acyl carrier protein [Streptococcus varani]|uniref:Acyl carrier protein n=1 Tax=Streptococcus varani TaxID=1608583 RepID=A0A0E4CTU8_9STRE|nr:phosphopantetheine-binding protein [Streptococcus varani]CQR26154.1 acyl carrier protein [Streptococcus varani]